MVKSFDLGAFVTLHNKKDSPTTLLVRPDGLKHKEREFPVTKKGCKSAGKWMAVIGVESYMSSSSLDFPEEYDVRFDPKEEIGIGYRQYLEEYGGKLKAAYYEAAQASFPTLLARFSIALDELSLEAISKLCEQCEIDI